MDSFSQLTDDLLIKILSFVPIKDAVATSMLSKRWLSLWTLLPRLNFEDFWVDVEETNQVDYKQCSSDFVFGTLLLHNSPVLDSFHLTRAFECSALKIELWVGFAVDRFVRDLKISFISEHCLIRLPSRLFRCETLETLELKRVIFLEVPSRFSFQSLKTLRLRAVRYADEESFIRLITSSPVLNNLFVESCSDDNVATFSINVPSLRSLTVRNTLQDSGPNYGNQFVIHPHSLNRLNIVDEYGEVNLIGKIPELVEASLYTMGTRGNALESLTCAKRLSLTLAYEAQYPIRTIFFQLVRLEFRGCGENWLNLLMHVLQHTPVLQILKLVVLDDGKINWNGEEDKVCWIQPSCDPECLLYHLKTFEWRDYVGSEEEKEVATYILKNTRRLVTATIRPDPVRVNQDQVFDELEFATRGSRACELTMG